MNIYGVPLTEPASSVREWLATKYQVVGGHRFTCWAGTHFLNGGRTFVIRLPKDEHVQGFQFYCSASCNDIKIELWHKGQDPWCRKCLLKGHLAEHCRRAPPVKPTTTVATKTAAVSGTSSKGGASKRKKARSSSSISDVEQGRGADDSFTIPRIEDTPPGKPDKIPSSSVADAGEDNNIVSGLSPAPSSAAENTEIISPGSWNLVTKKRSASGGKSETGEIAIPRKGHIWDVEYHFKMQNQKCWIRQGILFCNGLKIQETDTEWIVFGLSDKNESLFHSFTERFKRSEKKGW